MEHEAVKVTTQKLVYHMVALLEGIKMHSFVECPECFGKCDVVINFERDSNSFEVEIEVKVGWKSFSIFFNVIHPLHYQVHGTA